MSVPPELLFLADLIATFAIYLIIVISLNLEFGYTGVPNFGKALAIAGGAFVVGYFPGRLLAQLTQINSELDYIKHNAYIVTQLNKVLETDVLLSIAILLLTLVIAAVIGAFLGLVASFPAIRLRADYLAITLLVFAEAIRVIGHNYPPIAGGTLGVQVPDPFAWWGDLRFIAATTVLLAVALLVLLYVEIFTRSPLGRVLKAVRDCELAAASLGKNVLAIRTKTIVLSSAIAAIAGALYAFYTGGVIAAAYDRVTWTFWPWVMVIVGGAANNIGVMLGALIFVTVRKLIIFYKELLAPYIPFDVVWLDFLLLGVILILVLMYRPQGVLPEKPIRTVSNGEIKRRQ